jgi:hypothetical protein
MLMDLLYEMSRIQRIKLDDLGALCTKDAASRVLTFLPARVDDAFICKLFKLIEELSNDVNDPYHYPIIRLIVSPLTLTANGH